MQGVEYHIPELDYYNTNKQPKQYQRQQNQNVYLLPPPSIEDLCTWYGRDKEGPGISNYMTTDYMENKQGHWKAD